MKRESLSALTTTVRKALLIGGKVLRKGYRTSHRVTYKTRTSPVTQVDQLSEKKIISFVRRRFPNHTFLAEESAFLKKGDLEKSRPGRYRWIIDPLDGTVNFMHRIPHACVSIAVECNGKILAGGVYDPFKDELFLAARGKGATLNGHAIHVSDETRLIRSLLVTGFPYNHQKRSLFHAVLLEPFLKKMADVRRMGAAALDLAWIACGRLEAYWEVGLQPWDVAAGQLLVEEAGGKVTDFNNQPLPIDTPRETLATNGRLHAKIVRVFRCFKAVP